MVVLVKSIAALTRAFFLLSKVPLFCFILNCQNSKQRQLGGCPDTPSDHFGPFQPLTVKKQDSISFSPEMPRKAKELKGLRSNEKTQGTMKNSKEPYGALKS